MGVYNLPKAVVVVWICCKQTVLTATLALNVSTSVTARNYQTSATRLQDNASLAAQQDGRVTTVSQVLFVSPCFSRIYTVSKKRQPFYFYDNFLRCRVIFIILSLADSSVNLQ